MILDGALAAPRHEDHLCVMPAATASLHGVLNERLVDHRQHLLQTCALVAGKKTAFPDPRRERSPCRTFSISLTPFFFFFFCADVHQVLADFIARAAGASRAPRRMCHSYHSRRKLSLLLEIETICQHLVIFRLQCAGAGCPCRMV